MKILITGSNGYVGNFLSEHFSRQGIPVVGLDIASMPRQEAYPNFRFVKCDVRDRPFVQRIFADEQPTHVIHLAYLMDPQHDVGFEKEVDVAGSLNVFCAAHATESVIQFIHFSSASIYGGWPDNPIGITEDQRPRPREWVYAQNKMWVEDFYFRHPKRADFRLVNFRMCTAVGPSYYKKGGVVAVLARSPVGLLLDGHDAEIQFIHEDDVKALVGLVLRDREVEGVFNLAADSHSCQRELNPNPRKIFISLPKRLFRAIVAVLWKLRLSAVSPTSVDLVAHGIVVSPAKLQKRYSYTFLYSTRDAFFDAYGRRKANGTL